MSFTCSQLPPYIKWQCTLGILILTALVVLSISSVSSFPSKGDHECPNCSEQYIKTINAATGQCVECWRCPKCNDGTGSSVPCPSTVTVGTKIHCVLCVKGANFSDSSSTGQCQPCGVCSGKHEHVIQECTPESDVKCACDTGFYRNKTTNECLPCSFGPGWSKDDEIRSKCQKDEGETGKHPKLWPSTYGTSMSTVVDSEDGSTVVVAKTHLTALATSALVASSYSHNTFATPLLPGFTIVKAPVSSKTQPIRATSISILEHGKHERTRTLKATVQVQVIHHHVYKTRNSEHDHESSNKHTEIIVITSVSIACVFLLICVFLLYRKLKKLRTRQLNDDPRNQVYKFSELNQGAFDETEQGNNEISEEGYSCESSSVEELNAQCGGILHERTDGEGLSPIMNDLPVEDMCIQTVDLAHQDGRVLASDQSDQHSAAEVVQKGIPSSLEGEQRNCTTQAHRPFDFRKDARDDSAMASVAGTIVHSDKLDSLYKTIPSANTSTSVNVFLTFNDPSQIQGGTGAVPPFAEFASTSCDNNLVIPTTSSAMPVALNQGTICDLSSVAAPAAQPSQGNRGYSTHITHVPLPVIHKMCMLLDLEREIIDANDYRMLGNELGLNPLQISSLKQKSKSPSCVLLMQVFSAMPNSGTLEHLIPILKKMGRHDVIQVIDEWVGSQNCTQVAHVIN
ncbi:uncharacterized protein LOC144664622 [Oculina patagonica]